MDVKQPKALPLEKLQVPVSRLNYTLRPALHISWAEHRLLIEYKPLQLPLKDGTYPLGVKEEWVNRVDAMRLELQWLLGLPHHRFWSQIAYKIGHIDMVNSFLKAAPPFYIANWYRRDKVIWEHYIALFKIMFSVLKRLGTHSESITEFIGIKFYGKLLYKLCIFTIPSLLDICLLYSQHYRGDVINIVTTVITAQPKYLNDLISDLPFISITFKYVTWKLDESADSIHSLKSSHLLMLKLNPIDLQLFRIVLKNVIHTAATLNYFMDMYPPACQILLNEKFHFVLLSFYEITIPKMYKKLEKLVNKVDDECLYVNLKRKLHTTRVELLCSFKHILGSCFNRCVDFNSLQTELEHKKCINDYITILTECFLFKLFMRDYLNYYPIDVDLCALVQIYPDLKTKQSELTNLVNSNLNAFKPKLSMSCDDKTVPGLPVEKIRFLEHGEIMSPSPLKTSKASDGDKTPLPRVSGCSTAKGSADIVHASSVQLECLIEEVHSVFLNLGKGFIKRCLEVYNYSSECVIYSIYECSLPSSLGDLARDLPLTEEDSLNNVEIEMDDKERFRIPENLTSLLRKHHLKELRDTFMINGLIDKLVE